jgi:murein DD-endopeptidase MepM/ murein hydrolase activator NlpD
MTCPGANILLRTLSLLAILTLMGIVDIGPAARGVVNPDCETSFSLTNVPVEQNAQCQASLKRLGPLERNTPAVAVSAANRRLLGDAGLAALRLVPSIWPVLGRITGSFGHRLDPFSGKYTFHSGLDIASRYGDPVHATADGIVATMERRGGYGWLIVIDHGLGVTTWYGHLSRFATRSGTRVRLGDIIGYEGHSGRSTGTHLHYEVRVNDRPVNPWDYLRDVGTYPR